MPALQKSVQVWNGFAAFLQLENFASEIGGEHAPCTECISWRVTGTKRQGVCVCVCKREGKQRKETERESGRQKETERERQKKEVEKKDVRLRALALA